jgi:hypothetical protein
LEIVFLDVGFLLSFTVAYRLAAARTSELATTMKIAAPWLLLILLLFMIGVWILFQPMEMRGAF